MCDSDTVLDPACTIEMLKILEEDPMVGGVGGDVQVKKKQYISVMKIEVNLETLGPPKNFTESSVKHTF